MHILIVEPSAEFKAQLRAQVNEGLRQAAIRDLEILTCSEAAIAEQPWGTICGVLVGPSAHAHLAETVQRTRDVFPNGPVCVVLTEIEYGQDAPILTKRLGLRIYSIVELSALAGFLVECETQQSLIASRKNKNIFGVGQFKGGVGATSVAAALAACWARHGLKTALVDLDDVNPQLTSWARVGVARRAATAEHLALGHVPESRIADMAAAVETFNGKLAVIGQPEPYNEAFHFKANVIDGAPSASDFMHSLLSALKAHYDVVVIDLSRSWGLATFAALPRCERVLLVSDEDKQSMRSTIDSLLRLKKESDDAEEFDLSRWNIVVNGYSGDSLPHKVVRTMIDESDIFGESYEIPTIPYSVSGSNWGDPGVSLYDCADVECRKAIEKLAYELVPFRLSSDAQAAEPIDRPSGIFNVLRLRRKK